MESQTNVTGMLDLILRPAFSVKNGLIDYANYPAQCCFFTQGTPIADLLTTGAEEYDALEEGCLYLTLSLAEHRFSASVTPMGDYRIFTLEADEAQPSLQSMALAARELREPLSNIMLSADRLFKTLDVTEDAASRQQAQQMNRSLYQMLRLISNMSDAARYTTESTGSQQLQDITAVLYEIFEKAAALLSHSGITLHYTGPQEAIYTLTNTEKLERAVYNILSNAAKFSPAGSTITAKLTRRGSKLYLTICDNGSGIPSHLRTNVFSRYLRQPSLEDGLQGMGLGMVMIRSAAAAHGGTVLLEQAENMGTRITVTLAIRQSQDGSFRSPTLRIDYAGERDHGLLELADCLPPALYDIWE